MLGLYDGIRFCGSMGSSMTSSPVGMVNAVMRSMAWMGWLAASLWWHWRVRVAAGILGCPRVALILVLAFVILASWFSTFDRVLGIVS